MINFFKKNKSGREGFTLLYASMVAGLLLAIGAAILAITIKQVSLSAAGRQSQFAFYSSDTGIECAEYVYRLSRKDGCAEGDGLFTPPSFKLWIPNDPLCKYTDYKCLGVSLSNFTPPASTDSDPSIYTFSVNDTTDNICFDISVNITSASSTVVSRGYDTCNTANSRFERAIQADL
jgi:hypothetical protein